MLRATSCGVRPFVDCGALRIRITMFVEYNFYLRSFIDLIAANINAVNKRRCKIVRLLCDQVTDMLLVKIFVSFCTHKTVTTMVSIV